MDRIEYVENRGGPASQKNVDIGRFLARLAGRLRGVLRNLKEESRPLRPTRKKRKVTASRWKRAVIKTTSKKRLRMQAFFCQKKATKGVAEGGELPIGGYRRKPVGVLLRLDISFTYIFLYFK
jgi:hypothetical protein